MYFAKVIGSLWATKKDPSLSGEILRLIQPLNADKVAVGSPVVACDAIGADNGEIVLVATSTEAAIPLKLRTHRNLVATDATIVGIVERIDIIS